MFDCLSLFRSTSWKRSSFFFFNDTATTEIYTLSLHDALPISWCCRECQRYDHGKRRAAELFDCSDGAAASRAADRKSTRLNSSHSQISYAVFCLKKKKHRADSQSPIS